MQQSILSICITGACEDSVQDLIPQICSGNIFGEQVQLDIRLTDKNTQDYQEILEEYKSKILNEYPLVVNVLIDLESTAPYKDIDIAIIVRPIHKKSAIHNKIELLNSNRVFFSELGSVLSQQAKSHCKVVVAASPAAANCWILKEHTNNIPVTNFTYLTRLEYNNTVNEIAQKFNVRNEEIRNLILWGSDASYQLYPDLRYCTVQNKSISELMNTNEDSTKQFPKLLIKKSGSNVSQSTEKMNAAQKAQAITDHIRDWYIGIPENTEWTCMGIISNGQYGIPNGICFSFPLKTQNFQYEIIQNLEIDNITRIRIQDAVQELEKLIEEYHKNSVEQIDYDSNSFFGQGSQLSLNSLDFIREISSLTFTNGYQLEPEPLGTGAYGEVRKALHKPSGLYRAIKILTKSDLSEEDQAQFKKEVEILKQLNHPNIVQIYEYYEDDKMFYIVEDLLTGGELFDKIVSNSSFSEKQAAKLIKQILQALAYCHQRNIIHRDIKPENILYNSPADDAIIKLVDFGTSIILENNSLLNEQIGSVMYMAPEVIDGNYDQRCDVWSVGVLTYIILSGYPPFNSSKDEKVKKKIKKGVFTFHQEEWNSVSDLAKEFIQYLLVPQDQRPTAEEALNHQWIQQYTQDLEGDHTITSNVLKNLKNFRTENKLAQAFWCFMVNYLTTQEEKVELLKVFQNLDKNGDGKITKEELLSEFVMGTVNRTNLLSFDRLEVAFKMFDKNGDGKISFNEFKLIIKSSKNVFSDESLKKLFQEVDENGESYISFTEFKKMMLNFL